MYYVLFMIIMSISCYYVRMYALETVGFIESVEMVEVITKSKHLFTEFRANWLRIERC